MATLTLYITSPLSPDPVQTVSIPCEPDAAKQYELAWAHARSISDSAHVEDFDVEEDDNNSSRAYIIV